MTVIQQQFRGYEYLFSSSLRIVFSSVWVIYNKEEVKYLKMPLKMFSNTQNCCFIHSKTKDV